jgi:hypothetical protein
MLSDVCSDLGYSEVASIIDTIAERDDAGLPNEIKVGLRLLSFDRGERSLAQSLCDDNEAIIVTNDEDAFDALQELALSGDIAPYPVMSLTLTEAMYRCRALTADEATLVCDQAVASIAPGMSPAKRQRKQRQAEDIVQHIALEEAKRAQH